MKNKMIISISALGLLASLAIPTVAAEVQSRGLHPMSGYKMNLTEEEKAEMQAAKEARRAECMNLTEEEKAEMQAAKEARRAECMNLTEEEKAEMQAAKKARRAI